MTNNNSTVWDSKPLHPSSDPATRPTWVELKTSAELHTPSDALKFNRKLLKFWAQSFLLGVSKIIVGFRTNDIQGRLVRLQELETAKIPGLVREDCARNGKPPEWEKDAAINFLGEVLGWLKRTITKDGVWKMRRTERASTIELWKVEETGYGEVLSRDFVDWRQELARRKMGDGLNTEVIVGGES